MCTGKMMASGTRKPARRMRDSRVSIGKLADAEKGLFYPNRKYWEVFP